jgi:5-methylcytosine-specific restriction endonuclease McrA
VPKVVMLREFAPVHGKPKFCRASVYLRDRYRCQYCGERFERQDLTFDHLNPRARGGKTTWDNILTSCSPCNLAKRDGDLMKPLSLPRQPTHSELLRAGLELLPNDVKESFGDWLYWSAELER